MIIDYLPKTNLLDMDNIVDSQAYQVFQVMGNTMTTPVNMCTILQVIMRKLTSILVRLLYPTFMTILSTNSRLIIMILEDIRRPKQEAIMVDNMSMISLELMWIAGLLVILEQLGIQARLDILEPLTILDQLAIRERLAIRAHLVIRAHLSIRARLVILDHLTTLDLDTLIPLVILDTLLIIQGPINKTILANMLLVPTDRKGLLVTSTTQAQLSILTHTTEVTAVGMQVNI